MRTARTLYLLRFLRGDWLPGMWSAEARRFVPSLLLGVYAAHLEGGRLNKREAAAVMNADPASSGPKYIALAEEAGLIAIERRPDIDRRKDFLSATPKLVELLEKEQGVLEMLFSKADDTRPSISDDDSYFGLPYVIDWSRALKPLQK